MIRKVFEKEGDLDRFDKTTARLRKDLANMHDELDDLLDLPIREVGI
jgi:hypothetical protein